MIRSAILTTFLSLTGVAIAAPADVAGTARWLAGMEVSENSAATPAQRETDAAWQTLRATRLAPMKEFASRHFAAERDHCDTLLYPFGGPDILNALSFFPSCKRYVLFGLEHVGELPDLAHLGASQKARVIADMSKAQQYIVKRNFFVTQYMSAEVNSSSLKGVLPIMSAMLVRMGYVVTDIEPESLDLATPVVPGARPRAVLVRFHAAAGGPTQELIYASFDASDDGLGKDRAFLGLLASIHPTVTLMKAASYLLYDKSFSRMRAIVENESPLLVQDDTGLPYAELLAKGYSVELYGNYVGTIRAFSYRYQKDLAAAYRAQPGRSALPFAWSYAPRQEDASLQVARRTAVMAKSE